MLGVLSVSGASVLFKFATAEPLVVAMYRLAFSVLLLGIPLLWRRPGRIARRDLMLALLSGVFLAAHFGTWFFSLKLTSVASSTVLVTMHPFIVLLYGYFAWGERTRGWAVAGVALAVLGAILVSWGDFRLDASALLGDLLAFLGAVTVSGYFLIGRHLRQRLGAVEYSVLAYASATVVLLVAATLWGSPLTGFAPSNWWIFTALAVFPTIFGHTLFNWALKFVPASVISVSILGEPIGASILAWVIWRTAPGPMSLVGGTLILTGVGLFQWRREPT
ncbi:MAG TPA: DMT family transporter [Symbiobacteriaceae bacterium]|nr:DMT family transporter [Symbiobacteriaceae bacterium]